ncbi:YceI family protein [Caulobacter sp. 17J65-9]|uniref:YceI family protein n=1 Tax=Caulobacter sp. 17J65-9 TaxID=2709382 RepID=UPI0013CCE119|nr:YceI family protein [Caulobacter sp. 17J65-9]NEX92154.1 YceI family protein [Caulobacter sp. 17J65-9]
MVRVACVLSAAILMGFAAPAVAAGPVQDAPADHTAGTTPGAYTLDLGRSTLSARVSQLGVTTHTMKFGRFEGTLDVSSDPTASKVSVVVDATSAEAGSSAFDKRVADAMLDAAQYPQMKFASTRIERTGPTSGKIHGELTFRGVTRPLTLDAKISDIASGADGRPRVGVSATGSFKRSEFGSTEYQVLASDDVQLRIEAEFSRSAG